MTRLKLDPEMWLFVWSFLFFHMSHRTTKPTIWLVRPVWSESLQCAQWVDKDSSFLHADSEDSDQTGQMPRLIWDFAGCHFVGFVMRRLTCRESEQRRLWPHCCCCLIRFNVTFQIFFSHITMVSGCDIELNAHFYSAVSMKYHAPDTWHNTTPSHIKPACKTLNHSSSQLASCNTLDPRSRQCCF